MTLRRWWAGRTLRLRITVVVGVAALLALLLLSRMGSQFLTSALISAADTELRGRADAVATRIVAGDAPAALRGPELWIVDSTGTAVDGGPPLPLDDRQVGALAAGD